MRRTRQGSSGREPLLSIPQRGHDKAEGMTKQGMIASPCIGICELDDASGFCMGCARTMDEIVSWPDADRKQRLTILSAANERRRRGFRTVGSKRRTIRKS